MRARGPSLRRQPGPGRQKAPRASSSFSWPLGTRMVRGLYADLALGSFRPEGGGRLDSINSSCLPLAKNNNYEQLTTQWSSKSSRHNPKILPCGGGNKENCGTEGITPNSVFSKEGARRKSAGVGLASDWCRTGVGQVRSNK